MPIKAEILYSGEGSKTDEGTIYESYLWFVSTENPKDVELEYVLIDIENGVILGFRTFEEGTQLPLE